MNGSKWFKRATATVSVLAGISVMNGAQAVPSLQLYLEGSTYNTTTETWVAPSGAGPLRLWVIGTPGNQGPITDAKLVAAYSSSYGAGNLGLTVTSSTTGGFGGFTDPSTPVTAIALGEDTSETSPLMNSGAELERPDLFLPPHGIYGAGTYFQEFAIGDFVTVDSPTGDFITGFPAPSVSADAQINVYEITVSGVLGSEIHFDVYGTQNGKDVFAPFSHDAESSAGNNETPIPEPGQLLLLRLAVLGLGVARRKFPIAA